MAQKAIMGRFRATERNIILFFFSKRLFIDLNV